MKPIGALLTLQTDKHIRIHQVVQRHAQSIAGYFTGDGHSPASLEAIEFVGGRCGEKRRTWE